MSIGTSILNAVERAGNRLPDPVTIFVALIGIILLASFGLAALGTSVVHPVSGDSVTVQNLLTGSQLQNILVGMPGVLTGFAPLGMVLVVMIGAGIAEKTGLLAAGLRAMVRGVPASWLTPTLVFAGVMGNLAVDSGYIVLVPLGAVVFMAAGRHPVAGLAATFAGVSAGFSANLVVTALEPLLFGITQTAAQGIEPGWTLNNLDNYYFTLALTPILVLVGTFVNNRIVEPRLGEWVRPDDFAAPDSDDGLSTAEKKGLAWAGWSLLVMTAIVLWMTVPESGILRDANGGLGPFFRSIVAILMIAFLVSGTLYGIAVGEVKSDRDVVQLGSRSMADMGSYIILAFAMAHFIALFGASEIDTVIAISGAEGLRALDLPAPLLIVGMVLLVAVLNLFMGSASAKWALLAPVFVPMLMLLGISPEGATLAYRMGDQATNIITPLMPYLPLILIFAQRYVPEFGLGSLIAIMLPYSIAILLTSMAMLGVWFVFDLPLGPGDASFLYEMPQSVAPND
ncbi:MAG: iron ABC transporter substrate-binding protein [Flavobacteriaceae bacterium]|nr:iron ABC transporter substrate-binding protein [Flavobacteriaceae bacterium]